jgi:hypothetical protein
MPATTFTSFQDSLIRLFEAFNCGKLRKEAVAIEGFTCSVGFDLVNPKDLELSEAPNILRGEKEPPYELREAIKAGWVASGIPPVFATRNEATGDYLLQDGHRRWVAATERGYSEIPVIWIERIDFGLLLERGVAGHRLDVRDLVFEAFGLPVPSK